MAFHKPQIFRNLGIKIEQGDEEYSIFATTNVITMRTVLKEAAKVHLSGVPPKSKLYYQSKMGSSSHFIRSK